MVLIAAPTCPDCGSQLEQHEPDPLDVWWCWLGRTWWRLDEDGYLTPITKGAP